MLEKEGLPKEIAAIILNMLEKKEIANANLVCKQWQHLINSEEIIAAQKTLHDLSKKKELYTCNVFLLKIKY